VTAVSLRSARKAEFCLLEAELPGGPRLKAGVLLLDGERDELRVRLRADWSGVEEDDAEVLESLEEDLREWSRREGGAAVLSQLEDRLSNVLRISEREGVVVCDLAKALDRLYAEHVEGLGRSGASARGEGRRVPVYSLKAAAGGFGADMEVEPEGFVRAPENLRRTENLWAGRVAGRSMEPLIPDGSLCLFRRPVEGTRQGKLLLIQRQGASEGGGEFTVKRYTSVKSLSGEGWRHERIRLEPLNPEYEAWDLEPQELENGPYRVCGEFVQVLPYEEQ